MRHNSFQPAEKFIQQPINFNKYTDRNMLQYCLGATMYMPGTKDFLQPILTKKYPGLTSMVMCFEDACKEELVPAAEQNVLNLLDALNKELEKGTIKYTEIPLIIFRVRSVEQFKHFTSMLKPEHIHLITAFNFPKFNKRNGESYYSHLEELNIKFNEILYGMPILESKEMAYLELRIPELMGVKEILDRHKRLVLNIRVGGTDWSSVFGVRRGINYTIYDIMTVKDCLKDTLNVFARNNDYCVSGPVWEYFRANKYMKFSELPESINKSLFRRDSLINDAVDGLLRELLLDRANGFIGKTIIHPTHIPYINGMLAVTEEVYNDALQIMDTSGGVIKSVSGNKMNEIGPHRCWAEKVLMRSKAYGVIKDESCYSSLFVTT
ncbi:MAG: HpcH/HpaI aldolase/citrate lyase family protein [Faecalicatena sp.]|uniref:HpcH/HpaI aldolase/citrate lyase family protein n=1 Tax=Faecalicatena sp. TaxID=2005360 RepID=UPI00258D0098|nr:HpcH/HpaI aldolase/citrate lyase family protein [Faecalicatena sp.]MCI6465357.1 HpcH/HpaI aldolase/citrate lyase family protein [Faecalicatena sp.]MDY4669444.1 HpcH/HpaI aldolase/citrate lyase family protein [Oliverpabstia sp.]MDY5617481.1 HpcH/HpaI aldolase/citrate lyase family protein [Lachnospiraceae bacterium]